MGTDSRLYPDWNPLSLFRSAGAVSLICLATILGSCSDTPDAPARHDAQEIAVDEPRASEVELQARREAARREAAEARRAERRRAVEGAVRGFYSEVESRQYEKAWGRLTIAAQSAFGGFEKWSGGYETTTTLSARVAATSATAKSAQVRVGLRSKDLDECGDDVRQRWAGTWTVVRSGSRWLLDSQSFQKTGGGEVVRDASACPGYIPPYELSSGPNDGDGAADPPDSDDAPDPYVPDSGPPTTQKFGSGQGRVGYCNDGTLSDSIGRQGACSYHGGVR